MNAPFRRSSLVLTLLAPLALTLMAACAGSNDAAEGDSGAAAGQKAAAGGDSAAAGTDHSNMPGMNNSPAKDADHEFLRKMADHHEGMIVMLNGAPDKAASATAKADARKLIDKQRPERDSMVAMIKRDYNETHMPMAMQSAKTMAADLNQKSGAAYDRDMYGHVIMHHQEGVKMVDDFLPRLTKAPVRQMAEKMRADQQREIQEFQRKQQQGS